MSSDATDNSKRAKRFLLLLGFVSLFADMCYEGMRSALGPLLLFVGASASAIGWVSGIGEFIGYGLRYAAGRFVDRTGRYWLLTFIGYSVNLVAVPLLALAPSWPMIAALVALERLGKAIRSPAKTTIVSFATNGVGVGRAFAIQEAMDQAGAMLGPLLVAGVLAIRGNNASGFALAFMLLAAPAALSLLSLSRARALVPDPRSLDTTTSTSTSHAKLGRKYVWYMVGIAAIAIGLADWPLLAFHLQRTGTLAAEWTPVAYAAAMASDGLAAILAGLWFDRGRAQGQSGARVLAIFALLAAAYGPLVFATAQFGGMALPLVGIGFWSLGRAATEATAKSLIAATVPANIRGQAYGTFYVVFGGAWWLGSVALGMLYDVTPTATAGLASAALVLGAAILFVADVRHARATSAAATAAT
ncbi:MAG: MFS transporter [Kofleriaceae bacterium]|nr:MFS transporter [Kofleriaceae bacterium]